MGGNQQTTTGQVTAQHQHLPSVRVRRVWFRMTRITVIPDDRQTEIGYRGEGGCSGSDDDSGSARECGQEVLVADGRAIVSAQHRYRMSGRRAESLFDLGDVRGIGEHQQRAPTTISSCRRCLGDCCHPIGARGTTPHTPTAAGQSDQGRILGVSWLLDGIRSGRQRLLPLRLHCSRSGRHCQPHHVAETAGVVLSYCLTQLQHHVGEHRHRRDHRIEGSNRTVVVRIAAMSHDEAAQFLSRDGDFDPGTHHRSIDRVGRYREVQQPIQLRQR